MWLRVFCPTTQQVFPGTIAEELLSHGFNITPHFKGDDLGWTSADLILDATGTPIQLARFLTREDKLRDDLNSFAAELETLTYSKHASGLMERVIQTQQLMTIRKPLDHPHESRVESACECLVQLLARSGNGFYQIDGRGWFSATGELLVEEF